jgi:CheY-like chemotaxis protein
MPSFVLIVDDEPDFGNFQKWLLEDYGLTVAVATSGYEALELPEPEAEPLSRPGAIALVDMTMPELDGLGTIRGLQQRHPSLKFIATSGHSESRFRANLDSLGVRTFLPKPFTTDRLLQAMHNVLAEGCAAELQSRN